MINHHLPPWGTFLPLVSEGSGSPACVMCQAPCWELRALAVNETHKELTERMSSWQEEVMVPSAVATRVFHGPHSFR